MVILANFGPIGPDIDSIDLSADGLRLYYANRSGDLWVAHRDDRSATAFRDAARVVLDSRAFYVSLSPDELEIFYNNPDDPMSAMKLRRQTRGAADLPFDPGTEILHDDGADPDVSHDGTTLFLSIDNGLTMFTRTCGP
jgi:hypothetical protein